MKNFKFKQFKVLVVLVVLQIGFLLIPSYTHAWEPIGYLPYGPVDRIIEAEGRIWVGGGGMIFGFDPDDGNAPAVDTIMVYGAGNDLVYSDGKLYLPTDRSGLFIFDISDRPIRQIAHWTPPNDERLVGCAVLENGEIAITSSAGVVFFLNAVGDSLISAWSGGEGGFSRVACMGDMLVLARGPYPTRMMLMDASNVAEPESLSTTLFNDWVQNFLPVDDTRCYVSASTDGIYLMDFSDPRAPAEVDHAPIMYAGSKAGPMSLRDDVLLVSHLGSRNNPEGGLGIYSTELDSIHWFRWIGGAVEAPLMRDREAWVLKAQDGIYNVNLEELERPSINWLHRMPHQVEGVFVRDNLAYFAEGHGGLRIVDYSDPAHPYEIGWCENVGLMEDIWVDGDYAYVADGNGLLIYDVSDPTEPDIVAHIPIEQIQTRWVEGVTVESSVLYIASHFGLIMVDVTDPGDPRSLGSIDCTLLKDLAVRDSVVFMADSELLRIYDCSNPRDPVRLSEIQLPGGNGWDVALRDTLVLVSDRAFGLVIISISDVENPEIIGSLELESCQGLDDDGIYTYIGLVWDGIAVIDISDPENPEIIEHYDTPGGVLNVKSDGEIVVAADYSVGTSYFLRPDLQSVRKPVDTLLPGEMSLEISPNPFNGMVNLQFDLGKSALTTLRVIGLDGRVVETLLNGRMSAGTHTTIWKAHDQPAGLYFAELRSRDLVTTRKLILLK